MIRISSRAQSYIMRSARTIFSVQKKLGFILKELQKSPEADSHGEHCHCRGLGWNAAYRPCACWASSSLRYQMWHIARCRVWGVCISTETTQGCQREDNSWALSIHPQPPHHHAPRVASSFLFGGQWEEDFLCKGLMEGTVFTQWQDRSPPILRLNWFILLFNLWTLGCGTLCFWYHMHSGHVVQELELHTIKLGVY